jgi:SAM-dependent methyltransferase
MMSNEKLSAYWTPDRLKKLTNGKKFAVLPTNAGTLLVALGLLNRDGSMSADNMRKFNQINHLFAQLDHYLKAVNKQLPAVQILDVGCGKSYITFLLRWAYKEIYNHPAFFVGVDTSEKLVEASKAMATRLEFGSECQFFNMPADSITDDLFKIHKPDSGRPNITIALHACDTATDDAIAVGIKHKSDLIVVAPCCQAELAQIWKEKAEDSSPLGPLFRNPHLRRESAATFTDMLRVLLLRSHGYEVTTTEFTSSHNTPKNTLIVGVRRGNFHKASEAEYEAFKAHMGGPAIKLERLLELSAAPSALT